MSILGHGGGRQEGGGKWAGRGGDSDFSPRGEEALFAPGGGKGTVNCFKNPPKQALFAIV